MDTYEESFREIPMMAHYGRKIWNIIFLDLIHTTKVKTNPSYRSFEGLAGKLKYNEAKVMETFTRGEFGLRDIHE